MSNRGAVGSDKIVYAASDRSWIYWQEAAFRILFWQEWDGCSAKEWFIWRLYYDLMVELIEIRF